MVDALPAHVPPLPSSCVEVIMTGTAPDWSEKKITPDQPSCSRKTSGLATHPRSLELVESAFAGPRPYGSAG